jgi:glycine cleavage system H protein
VSEASAIPDELRYTADHEWARQTTDAGSVVRIGITDYAQNSLGDIVFVQLPELGATVGAGEALGEVESTKSVSDVVSPVAGQIVARNEQVEANPELANSDPYGDGWLVEIEVSDPAQYDTLLDADAYRELTAS